MPLRSKARTGAPDPDLFLRFSRSFPTSARWRAYFVRWERHAQAGPWPVHFWFEVSGDGRACVRVFTASSSRQTPDPGALEWLQNDLDGLGYERLPERSFGQFVKWFRPTGRLLLAAGRELETRFWPEERTRRLPRTGSGGVSGALHLFMRATAWTPAACGWEWRFDLSDGIETQLVMLVHPCGKSGQLAPEPMVLFYAPRSAARDRLRRLRVLCHTAGYAGEFNVARPRGREPFLFGDFQKEPLAFNQTTAERARLDELARAIRRLG
jgi:hypothetical protein